MQNCCNDQKHLHLCKRFANTGSFTWNNTKYHTLFKYINPLVTSATIECANYLNFNIPFLTENFNVFNYRLLWGKYVVKNSFFNRNLFGELVKMCLFTFYKSKISWYLFFHFYKCLYITFLYSIRAVWVRKILEF